MTAHSPRRSRPGRAIVVAVLILAIAAAASLAIAWWRGRGATGPSSSAETPAATTPWFRDAASSAGIEFEHVRASETHFWFPEILCGGGAFLDFDGDGWQDIYLVQSGDLTAPDSGTWANKLYRNTGDGRFEDVTASAGVGDRGYGMGCTCGDFDHDGDVDIYITNVGADVLYRNNGDGTFTDITAGAGLGDTGWGTSCAFLDFDGDLDLDLFVTRYVNWAPQREIECRAGNGERDFCKPNNYNAPSTDVFYRNEGDGTFTNVTAAAGIETAFGNGLGVATGDFNGDGRIDIYVANDGNANQLWLNLGNGRFIDDALRMGCAVNMQGVAEAGMGVAAVDIESDGDLDLFMTHLRDETNTFYENQDGVFLDTTATSGLSIASIRYTGFGMGLADFDNDGRLDVFIANGRVGRWTPAPNPDDNYGEPNQLYSGGADGRFAEVAPRGGCAVPFAYNSRAAAFADYDNDGDIDILVVNNNGPARLLQNTIGDDGNSIVLRIRDGGSDALGASVTITAGAQTQRRIVQSAYSYCASNDARVHFGLGSATRIDSLTVAYPDGTIETHGPLDANQTLAIVKGSGR